MSTIEDAENAVRDLKNWIAVFAEEHDLPEDAKETLHQKIDDLARIVGEIGQ